MRRLERFTRKSNSRLRPLLVVLALALAGGVGGCASSPVRAIAPSHPSDAVSRQPDAFSRGVRDYRQGLYDSAVRELNSVDPKHPKFKEAKVYLGKAGRRVSESSNHMTAAAEYHKAGELFKAKAELTGALEIYPEQPGARSFLETLEEEIRSRVDFSLQEGRRQFEQQNLEAARVALLEALKVAPEETQALSMLSEINSIRVNGYYAEGNKLALSGKVEEAINEFEKAYALNASDPAVGTYLTLLYNQRALKFYREEKLALAARELLRSLEIKADQGEVERQLHRINERIELLKTISP